MSIMRVARIKITRCSHRRGWYAKRVGETVEVYVAPPSASGEAVYLLKADVDAVDGFAPRAIELGDAEEVDDGVA